MFVYVLHIYIYIYICIHIHPLFNKGFLSIERNPLLWNEIPYYKGEPLIYGGGYAILVAYPPPGSRTEP